GDARADSAEQSSHEQRKKRREQEEDEGLRQNRRREITAGDDQRGADEAHHGTFSCPICASALLPAMTIKASCSPGRSMESYQMPAPPSSSARSSDSGPA